MGPEIKVIVAFNYIKSVISRKLNTKDRKSKSASVLPLQLQFDNSSINLMFKLSHLTWKSSHKMKFSKFFGHNALDYASMIN